MVLGGKAWAVLKTTLFGSVFIALFVVYLPWALAIRAHTVNYDGLGALRLLGVAPLIAGAYMALRCAFGFAWTGLGTPVPFDPPRTLVVTGFYRYVRNPMFIGVAALLLGEIIVFGSIRAGLQYLLVFGGCVVLFILLYEEPALRVQFGADYHEYCRNVPRFFPRLTPWEKRHDPTGTSS